MFIYTDHDTKPWIKSARHGSLGGYRQAAGIEWEPRGTPIDDKPLNPDYPSCPLGLRITDLPHGWAVGGNRRYSGVPTEKLPEEVATIIKEEVASGQRSRTAIAISHGISYRTLLRIMKRGT